MSLSDTQVGQLRRGDVVRDLSTGLRLTVSGDARISRTHTHYEAWATGGKTGALVVRVTHSGNFEKEEA